MDNKEPGQIDKTLEDNISKNDLINENDITSATELDPFKVQISQNNITNSKISEQKPTNIKPKKNNRFVVLIIATVLMVLGAGGASAYYLYINNSKDNSASVNEDNLDSNSDISNMKELVINPNDNNSSELLKKAWIYAFGRDANASEAYNYSIKAMEAASWPIIMPANNSATLGHILGELRTNPEKWHSQIFEKNVGATSVTLTNAMQLIWEGHTDRHGTANPVQVTQEAAEQAVFTAVMVYAYFNRNYVVPN